MSFSEITASRPKPYCIHKNEPFTITAFNETVTGKKLIKFHFIRRLLVTA